MPLITTVRKHKRNRHRYTQHDQRHFAPLRHKRLNVLEIGVGGYEDPELGGGSLRMWRTYFPRSMIYAVDIFDETPQNEQRIKIFKGSQVDEQFLSHVIDEIGSIDIIIDDGSHLNEHVLKTFHYLFPRLSDNGICVVEDTQTFYWPSGGGSSNDLNLHSTSMRFLKTLIDAVNYREFERQDYQPTYFDRNIVGLHLDHNLVFVQKGRNDERSNVRGK